MPVPVAGPVDLAGSLDVFRRSGDDLLDRWDGRVWLRAMAVDGHMVGVAARPAGTLADPALVVTAEAGADPGAAGRALAGAFVTAPEALAELAAADPVVAGIAARFPGVGPVLQPDLLTAVVRAISAQQITLRFAATLRGRLARRYGRRHQVPVPPEVPGVWTATSSRSDRRLPSRSGAPASRGGGDRWPDEQGDRPDEQGVRPGEQGDPIPEDPAAGHRPGEGDRRHRLGGGELQLAEVVHGRPGKPSRVQAPHLGRRSRLRRPGLQRPGSKRPGSKRPSLQRPS
ncbi:MAG TPA: hypothetical protein VFQ49_13810, partial [Actinomycetes bacterium]|nr:hypothetical protein [Actinomycetes bacterium]